MHEPLKNKTFMSLFTLDSQENLVVEITRFGWEPKFCFDENSYQIISLYRWEPYCRILLGICMVNASVCGVLQEFLAIVSPWRQSSSK